MCIVVLGFSTSLGRLAMMAFILNALTCAVGLLYFIRRGKQCLDFTVTVHFFHLLGCWIYNAHFPTALTWWLVHTVCTALMAVIGEYLCMRTELKEIPLNSAPKSNDNGLQVAHNVNFILPPSPEKCDICFTSEKYFEQNQGNRSGQDTVSPSAAVIPGGSTKDEEESDHIYWIEKNYLKKNKDCNFSLECYSLLIKQNFIVYMAAGRGADMENGQRGLDAEQMQQQQLKLRSISSMEVNVDMLEQMDMMDLSDQDTVDVFLSCGTEDNNNVTPLLPDSNLYQDEISLQVPNTAEIKSRISSTSSASTDLNSLDTSEEGAETPVVQSDEEELQQDGPDEQETKS
ncbi:hypothetical protein EYD10_12556 [Varanus komodoensis]|nr:hypothetical protein EYD10_12556 [Varanus komodoensis]